MNNYRKILIDAETNADSVFFFDESAFKVEKLLEKIKEAFSNKGFEQLYQIIQSVGQINPNSSQWFNTGVECQFLEPNKSWKKGKVKIKIVLEFESDELEELPNLENTVPESPLDDIRREINQS